MTSKDEDDYLEGIDAETKKQLSTSGRYSQFARETENKPARFLEIDERPIDDKPKSGSGDSGTGNGDTRSSNSRQTGGRANNGQAVNSS